MKYIKTIRNLVCLLTIAVFVAGCANKAGVKTSGKTNQGRYKVTKDYGPNAVVDVSHVEDAVPKVEPLSRGGNRSQYEVLGKTYSVMPSAVGFKERGGASWYGKKFHGYKTANGDRYDMYGMTAAHKSLPIPTYVKVTNLSNNKQVIVRVNDRGPFHKGRVIDLSYAAAAKLDMLNNGTAQVEVEAINPSTWKSNQNNRASKTMQKLDVAKDKEQQFLLKTADKPQFVDNLNQSTVSKTPVIVNNKAAVDNTIIEVTGNEKAFSYTPPKPTSTVIPGSDQYIDIHYIQVGAYSTEAAAHEVTLKVNKFDLPVLISEIVRNDRKLYKVIIGPMQSRKNTEKIKVELSGLGFPAAHLIDLPK